MRINDAITGAVLVIFALAEITYTRTFPSLHGQSYGPNLFPTLIGYGLIACGIGLIVRGLLQKTQLAENAWVSMEAFAGNPSAKINFMLVLVALVLYIFLSPVIGFIPLSVLILGVLLYRLGSSLTVSVLVAVAATIVIQLLFARLLLVPLPAGIMQGIVW